MRSPKTKTDLHRHVKRRALERFGLDINHQDIAAVVGLIQNDKATFVDKQSNNLTRWIVSLKDVQVGTVYDKQRKMIRTVMPVEWLYESKSTSHEVVQKEMAS